MANNKLLWLDKYEVEKLLDMSGTMRVVEDAFREHGLKKVQMPPKLYLYFEKHNGDLRTMPAYLEDLDIAGVKIVNVHPDNPAKKLPTVMALLVLNSTETGAPIAIMDATHLTNMRTGAAGGIAAKYLANKKPGVIGMVGAGNQARTQLIALKEVMKIKSVKVSTRSKEESISFKKEMERIIGCDVSITDIKNTCDCDILVTTTPVRSPIIKNEWIYEGTHINAIGADAPGKEELEPEILKRAKVVVDDLPQAAHSGEVNVPITKGIFSVEDVYGELGEIIAGKKTGRQNKDEITIFDSTGLAIQDVATANLVYKKAIEEKVGLLLRQF